MVEVMKTKARIHSQQVGVGLVTLTMAFSSIAGEQDSAPSTAANHAPVSAGVEEPSEDPIVSEESSTADEATDANPLASPQPSLEPAEKAGRAQVVSIGFIDPTVYGIEKPLADVVSLAIVTEVRKHQGLSVLSMQEVKAMLQHEANSQMAGCSEESCLAELAEALGFDEIVLTTMSAVDGGHVLQVKRINQREAKAMNGVTKRVEDNGGEGMLAVVGSLVDELFPDHPLREGVKRGVAPEVALSLNPPPISLGLWGSLAGTTIGLLGAATISAIAASVLQASAQSQVDASVGGEPASGGAVVATLGAATVFTYGAYAVGVAGFGLAGVTGALSVITDWRGYGSAE